MSQDVSMVIRPIEDAELKAGYRIIEETAVWIRKKGLHQRIGETSFDQYTRWQRQGGNFGVFSGEEIVGVFSLVDDTLDDWPAFAEKGEVKWLRALATHPNHRGRRVGEKAIHWAIHDVEQGVFLYLDCVTGFLPTYYQSQGFTTISRRVMHDEQGREWDITLLSQEGRKSTNK